MRQPSQTTQASTSIPAPLPVTIPLRPLPLRLGLWLALLSWAIIAVPSFPAQAQDIDREYKLKAVYLYKFATYVEWPKQAFHDADSPFVIGILGPDPVGNNLRKIANEKKIDGRRIEVLNYQQPAEIKDCHILFMPRTLPPEIRRSAVKLLAGRNILLVGEESGFLEQGGVVDFVIAGNRIQIHISQPAYEREQLEVSSQLLRIANVVK